MTAPMEFCVKSVMVIITGVARSGTSAIAGIVHHLGVDLGAFYLKPDTQNPTGYFEDARILDIDFKYFEQDRPRWRKEMKKYLASRKGIWGFKNPAFSVTIKEVQALLKELGITSKYILCTRNLNATDASRQKHYGKENPIKPHKEALEEALTEEEILTVSFDDTLRQPDKTTKEIIEFLHLKPTPNQQLRAVLSVIQPPPKEGESIIAVPSHVYR
jgi:hypothetical protein